MRSSVACVAAIVGIGVYGLLAAPVAPPDAPPAYHGPLPIGGVR
jgi:hypothetical protein